MKLTKEQVYINLQGKSKEELTELYWLLKNNNQNLFHNDLSVFIEEYYRTNRFLEYYNKRWGGGDNSKTEVTIQQLKEILQPMKEFTPTAMRCTQEQFDAIKPKLEGLEIHRMGSFETDRYLVNNAYSKNGIILNFGLYNSRLNDREIHEEWNEEIFLKACGIEVESLEQQLQKAKAEVKRLQSLIEEENRPKVGDWVKDTNNVIFKYQQWMIASPTWVKVTDQELINKLNELIK